MKTAFLLLAALTAHSEGPSLRYSLTPDKKLCLSWRAKVGATYSIARIDLRTHYTDSITNGIAGTNGVMAVTLDPLRTSDEDQPAPSGQCVFYLVEHEWPRIGQP